MLNLTFDYKGKSYKQISKASARKLFIAGGKVVICPANMRPFSMWHLEYIMKRAYVSDFILDDIGASNIFNEIVNNFKYYNCNNETGNYIRYYAEV